MTKKVFSSQGNFDMGRNRAQRRLEARLDHLKKRVNNYNHQESNICIHESYCPNNIQKSIVKCILGSECKIKSFYDKYPDYKMFIRSKICE